MPKIYEHFCKISKTGHAIENGIWSLPTGMADKLVGCSGIASVRQMVIGEGGFKTAYPKYGKLPDMFYVCGTWGVGFTDDGRNLIEDDFKDKGLWAQATTDDSQHIHIFIIDHYFDLRDVTIDFAASKRNSGGISELAGATFSEKSDQLSIFKISEYRGPTLYSEHIVDKFKQSGLSYGIFTEFHSTEHGLEKFRQLGRELYA